MQEQHQPLLQQQHQQQQQQQQQQGHFSGVPGNAAGMVMAMQQDGRMSGCLPRGMMPVQQLGQTSGGMPSNAMKIQQLGQTSRDMPSSMMPVQQLGQTPSGMVPVQQLGQTPSGMVPVQQLGQTPSGMIPVQQLGQASGTAPGGTTPVQQQGRMQLGMPKGLVPSEQPGTGMLQQQQQQQQLLQMQQRHHLLLAAQASGANPEAVTSDTKSLPQVYHQVNCGGGFVGKGCGCRRNSLLQALGSCLVQPYLHAGQSAVLAHAALCCQGCRMLLPHAVMFDGSSSKKVCVALKSSGAPRQCSTPGSLKSTTLIGGLCLRPCTGGSSGRLASFPPCSPLCCLSIDLLLINPCLE